MKRIYLLSGCLALSAVLSGCDMLTDKDDNEQVVSENTTTTTRADKEVDNPAADIYKNSSDKTGDQVLSDDVRAQNRDDNDAEVATKIDKSGKTAEQNSKIAKTIDKGTDANNRMDDDRTLADSKHSKSGLADADDSERTIAQLTLTEPELGNLHQLLVLADMDDMLASGHYTLLAPNNQAFTKLPRAQLDGLRQDKQKLRQVLMNHLIQRPLSSSELNQLPNAQTMHVGKQLVITKSADGKPVIQQAHLVRPDIWASNGMVHIIDKFIQ
ncbi:MAG: fasciclin domain-containing protein [Candidatus Sericytochromatia bacterium]